MKQIWSVKKFLGYFFFFYVDRHFIENSSQHSQNWLCGIIGQMFWIPHVWKCRFSKEANRRLKRQDLFQTVFEPKPWCFIIPILKVWAKLSFSNRNCLFYQQKFWPNNFGWDPKTLYHPKNFEPKIKNFLKTKCPEQNDLWGLIMFFRDQNTFRTLAPWIQNIGLNSF